MNKKTAFIVRVNLLRNMEKLEANNVINVSIATNNSLTDSDLIKLKFGMNTYQANKHTNSYLNVTGLVPEPFSVISKALK